MLVGSIPVESGKYVTQFMRELIRILRPICVTFRKINSAVFRPINRPWFETPCRHTNQMAGLILEHVSQFIANEPQYTMNHGKTIRSQIAFYYSQIMP